MMFCWQLTLGQVAKLHWLRWGAERSLLGDCGRFVASDGHKKPPKSMISQNTPSFCDSSMIHVRNFRRSQQTPTATTAK
jgi:hypothetical protein